MERWASDSLLLCQYGFWINTTKHDEHHVASIPDDGAEQESIPGQLLSDTGPTAGEREC